MPINYLLGSIFFTPFSKYVKLGSGKKVDVLTTNQGKVRELSGYFDSYIGNELLGLV